MNFFNKRILHRFFIFNILQFVYGEDVDCDLYELDCAETGFKIKVNSTCQAKFQNLNFNDLYIYSGDIEERNEPTWDNLDDMCKFDDDGTASIIFGDCFAEKGFPIVINKLPVYRVYNRHKISGTYIYRGDVPDYRITCAIGSITWTPNNINNLVLDVGLASENETFVPLAQNAGILHKQPLSLRLRQESSNYKLALIDCEFVCRDQADFTSPVRIELFNTYCPNPISQMVELEWVDYTSFDVMAFRAWNTDSLTISCNVRLFGNNDTMPEPCPKRSRRNALNIGIPLSTSVETVNLKFLEGEYKGGDSFIALNVWILLLLSLF